MSAEGVKGTSSFFPKILFLSNFYPQRGARTQDPAIKSHLVYRLSRPGARHRPILGALVCCGQKAGKRRRVELSR